MWAVPWKYGYSSCIDSTGSTEPVLKQGESCLAKTRAPGSTSHLDGVSQERVPTVFVCASLSSRISFLWTHYNEDMFLIRPGFESATSYNTALSFQAGGSELWVIPSEVQVDQHCPLHTAGPPCHAPSTGPRGCQAQQRWPKAQPLSTRAALPHEQQGSFSEAWSDIFPLAINSLISTWSQTAVKLEM